MNLKHLSVFALLLLITSRILLAQGNHFLFTQQPIDFVHWLMLVGASLTIVFSFIFPKSIINTIATSLTILGIVAHIGMCAIDFVFWSFGEDYDGRRELMIHLMDTPAIWLPFMVVGPIFLYAGLATHAWQFIRTHTLRAITTLVGSGVIGLGQMVWHNQWLVIVGYIVFSLGLVLLVYRKETPVGT